MQKTEQKLSALSRITSYMDVPKRRLLLNLFLIYQFSYCSLAWMRQRHSKNNKINLIHERCSRTIYCDKSSTYEELLDKDGFVTKHKWNLQFLATEMFTDAKNSAPTMFYEIFFKNEQNICNLRNTTEFNISLAKLICKRFILFRTWGMEYVASWK